MCNPSYAFRGTPVVARMCVYTVRKNYYLQKSIETRTKHIFKNEKSRDAAKKSRYKISRDIMRKSIYLLTTTRTSHTHRFHPHPPPANHTHRIRPLSTIVIHTFNFAQVRSMDDNCGEWVQSMGVARGCGCKVVYRFPHISYPYSSCICSFLQQHPYFLFIF